MTYEKMLYAVGVKIREARKRAGLTQEDMAQFGFNVRHYQDIEAGKINFTLDTLYRIARTLKISPATLVDLD